MGHYTSDHTYFCLCKVRVSISYYYYYLILVVSAQVWYGSTRFFTANKEKLTNLEEVLRCR